MPYDVNAGDRMLRDDVCVEVNKSTSVILFEESVMVMSITQESVGCNILIGGVFYGAATFGNTHKAV
jgi:hypothetical protein